MNNLVKVVPAEGVSIRQPNRNNRIMPAEGDFVSPDDTFYTRLILSGDLLVVEEKPAREEPAPAQEQPLGKKHK